MVKKERNAGGKRSDNGALSASNARTKFCGSKAERKRVKAAEHVNGREGQTFDVDKIRNKKLRTKFEKVEKKFQDAVSKAKDAEILDDQPRGFLELETELESTWRVRQEEIVEEAAIETAHKKFELKLDGLGPYIFDYTRTGRHMLLAGRKGHVASFDWREGKLGCELQLGETIRDCQWLYNNQYFALAQKKNVYIYDHDGVEIHCLHKNREVSLMEFLPYHFLLAMMEMNGWLRYLDVSTGQQVSGVSTKKGTPVSMAQNPWNAILHVGQSNGTVTLWSPNASDPLAKLLVGRGPVRALDMDRQGRYMVTAGADLRMAVWDIRMFKEVNNYFLRSQPSSVSISQTGLTAVGWNTKTTVWKGLFSEEKVQSPYMTWGGHGQVVERVQWCPYEDVLGIGHNNGFASILVPGAGEANFDSLEDNPFETKKQRQEGEIKALLNKLQPEMIALDSNFIGDMDMRSEEQKKADKDLDAKPPTVEEVIKNKARGKNGALAKYIRKQRKKNIIDEKRMKVEELWLARQQKNNEQLLERKAELGPALARFARKE